MPRKGRRIISYVTEHTPKPQGKARVFAYSLASIARCIDRSERTVRRAVVAGKVDPSSLLSVVTYIHTHQKP